MVINEYFVKTGGILSGISCSLDRQEHRGHTETTTLGGYSVLQTTSGQ